MRYWFAPGLGTGRSVSYFRDEGPPGVALLVNEDGRWRACMYLGIWVCSLIVLEVIFVCLPVCLLNRCFLSWVAYAASLTRMVLPDYLQFLLLNLSP